MNPNDEIIETWSAFREKLILANANPFWNLSGFFIHGSLFSAEFFKTIKWLESVKILKPRDFWDSGGKVILLISDLVWVYHSVKLTDAGEMSKFNPHGWAASTKMNDVGL